MLEPAAVLNYLLGASLHGGATASDLGLRLGISRSRAAELLLDLPEHRVREERDQNGRVLRFAAQPIGEEEGAQAWRDFLIAARRERRGHPMRARPARVAEFAARARVALAEGDIQALRRLLAEPLLDPIIVRRGVPLRWRDPLTIELLHLQADAAMQAGRPLPALAAIDRALTLDTDAERRIILLAIGAAARRMMSREGAVAAIAMYRAALNQTAQLSPEAARRQRRLLHGEVVAPLLVVGAITEAAEHIARSLDQVDQVDAGWVQTTLREAQVSAALGHLDEAREQLAAVNAARTPVHRWLDGWAARIALGLCDRPEVEHWSVAMALAWRTNRGYGFQLRIVLARLAAEPERFQATLFDGDVLREMRQEVARLHIAELGSRPSDCRVCRRAVLPVRAAHSLGIQCGRMDPLYTT